MVPCFIHFCYRTNTMKINGIYFLSEYYFLVDVNVVILKVHRKTGIYQFTMLPLCHKNMLANYYSK